MNALSDLRAFPAILLLLLLAQGTQPAELGDSPEPGMITDPVELRRIHEALPAKAPAQPGRARKLLIFDLNVGYPGHGSIPYANQAFYLMGQKTGAFQTVISRDPEIFRRGSLSRFDAVFLNNTVGNLFQDRELRRNLVEFVYGGGGLMGLHGTSVAFTKWPGALEDWPEFGVMIGARGANHRDSNEHVFIRLDDPEHPLNRPWSRQGFEYRDEFFRFGQPYSRQRVRVLFSIDNAKTDTAQGGPARGNVFRADNDYALAWVRSYGRGRIFYCTIGHNPRVFQDPQMLQFYLGAAQFVLGDLPAPTLPSAHLTPATGAQEKLGWRLGIEARIFPGSTFFEAIDRTSRLGLLYIGALSAQKVSREIPRGFGPDLCDDEMEKIRMKLDVAGLRLLTWSVDSLPADESGRRRVFEFARRMGIEAIISRPAPEAMDSIERLCDEYDIRLGIANHFQAHPPYYQSPQDLLGACKGRSTRIGACGDVGAWLRSGIDPVEAVRTLGNRLVGLRIQDLRDLKESSQQVPWGTGQGRTLQLLEEIHRLAIAPTVLFVDWPFDGSDWPPEIVRCIEFFNRTSLRLAQ